MNPFFKVFTGPMFGSKTTRLMAEIDRATYRGRNIFAFKAKRDQRYKKDSISTHSGGSYPAHCIEHAEEIYKFLSEEDNQLHTIIAIDEAFMIEKIDDVLIDLYRRGYNIVVSSIQLDANEIPFDSIKNILPWATHIEVCPAVCTKCDQDAYFTEALFDIANATAEERVGSKGMYEPRCATHYSDFRNKNYMLQ